MEEKLMIRQELSNLEKRIRNKVSNVLSNLTQKLNESLNVILQSTIANAEEIENSVNSEIKGFNLLLDIKNGEEEFQPDDIGCELNPFIKIDYIPARSSDGKAAVQRSKADKRQRIRSKTKDPLLFQNEYANDEDVLIPLKQVKAEMGMQESEDLSSSNETEESNIISRKMSSRNGKQHVDMNMNTEFIQCEQCEYNAINPQKLKSHIRNAHQKNFMCPHCKYASRDNLSLSYHIRAVHEKRKDYKCTECNFAAGFNHSLTNHMRRVHNE